jgi:peptidoglycan/xylan/chitin deacetylase (PgdA/CDA1 family)
MWRHWLKSGSASVLAAMGLDRVVAGVTGWGRRPLILGYHRVVADHRPDPTVSLPSMDISVRMLTAQLEWVARRYRLVSLDDLGRLLESGDRGGLPPAAVTVDDGYRDAYDLAFPTFRRLGIPAAFFVVTDLVGSSEALLHDRLYYQLARGYAREGRLPLVARHVLGRLDLSPAAGARLLHAPNAYDALQAVFEACDQAEARKLTDVMEADAPLPMSVAARLRCADWGMLRAMAAAGMTIGSHTRSHVLLNRERPATVQKEITGSRRRLEEELGRPAEHFAYPAGQFDASAVKAVAAAGYRYAYTACGHIVPSHAHLTIPRKLLWERSCVAADGSFSPSVMNAQVSGFFDLVHPPCVLDHGMVPRPVLASASC